MASRRTYPLRTVDQRKRLITDVMRAPDDWIAPLAEPTRTLEQNAKLWPMLGELQRQVPELRPYSTEDIKFRFMDALGSEMRFLPKLEGQGMFPVGLRSSTLTVDQFSALIELIYAYGAKHGVRWSDEPQQEQAA
jgi:hypothetical protein